MKRIVISTILALSVSACTIQPKPLTTGAVTDFATDKLSRVTAGQQPITNSITLYEAMARALKYNLDFHVELYNEALASKELEVARLEMLPNFVASAAYTSRNNRAGTFGSTVFPDRRKFEEDINLSWNILDLGLSKVRAEQAADQVLVAREKRRRIINRVIEDVRTAYWRAVSADRLLVGLRKLEGRAQKALRNSRALQRDGQTSPLTALTYQRELVEIQQRIQRLQKDLSLAKIQLAALMNVKPGTQFTLAQPKRRVDSTYLPLTSEEMVFAALENRPEIRDIQYKLRINAKESKRALLELLPGVNIFANANWNSDDALLNTNWVGWGARATFNLLNVFKYPAKKRLIKAEEDTLDARALAVTMAIMTQVHVSRVRYGHARKTFITASKHLKVQNGIVRQVRASFREGQASEQTLIREEMNTLASRVSSDVAYAELQNAYANIYASMGIDPYTDETFADDNLDVLTDALQKEWFERGDNSGVGRAKRSARNFMSTGSIEAKSGTAALDKTPTGSVKPAESKDPIAAEVEPTSADPLAPSASDTQVTTIKAKPKKTLMSLLGAAGSNGVRTVNKTADSTR